MQPRALLLAAAAALLVSSCQEAQEAPKGEKTPKAPGIKGGGAPALQIAAWFGSEPLALDGLALGLEGMHNRFHHNPEARHDAALVLREVAGPAQRKKVFAGRREDRPL